MNRLVAYFVNDPTGRLLAGFITALILLTLGAGLAAKLARGSRFEPTFRQTRRRVYGLWLIVLVFSIALLTGGVGSVLVFAGSSFLLLRESLTITPTRKADHRTLCWLFFVILPLHYGILAYGWYGLFAILIPVYAFLFIPIRMIADYDPERFLERAAKTQWALMICVYCVSHAPALIKLTVPGVPGAGARLLLFLCIVVQANDMVHDLVDGLWGRHPSIPHMEGPRSLEGLAAGVAVGTGVGAAMAGCTPLSLLQAIILAVLACLLGSAGQTCLAAIRRERGREGVVIVHRGQDMMGRVISLCFAAPVFFHIVRLWLDPENLQFF
jgi:phosphatidate cytidylyltransferase